MHSHPKDNFYTESIPFTIFALVDTSENRAFIWKTKNPNLKKVYEQHYCLGNAQTREMFSECRSAHTPPGMYILETVEVTENIAYKHVLAWITLFSRFGYTIVNYSEQLSQVNCMDEDAQKIYDSLPLVSPYDICESENALFSNYGQQRKKKDKPERPQVSFALSQEEYDKIRAAASDQHLSMSRYAKEMTLKGNIHIENYDFFMDYQKQLQAIERRIKGILVTIYDTGNYRPADLEAIQGMLDQAGEIHLDAMRLFNKRRYGKRTRRKP